MGVACLTWQVCRQAACKLQKRKLSCHGPSGSISHPQQCSNRVSMPQPSSVAVHSVVQSRCEERSNDSLGQHHT